MTTAASSVVSTTSTTSPLANLSTIDVTALVSNIMSTEKVQQTNLKTTLSDTQTKLAALQGLKSNVSDLQTSAESIIGSVYNVLPHSLLDPGISIASLIANTFQEATTKLDIAALIELGLILFLLTLFFQIIAQFWLRRVQRTTGGRA